MPKPSLYISRPLPVAVCNRINDLFHAQFGSDEDIFDIESWLHAVASVDAVLVTVTEKLSADVIARLPDSVRMITTFSVGYEHIDLEAARARGITVTNTPGAVVEATADIALLLMIGAARRAAEGGRMIRDNKWIGWRPTQLLGQDVHGARLGILGFGGIGQAVARRAGGFDMEIHYHGPRRKTGEHLPQAVYHDSLESLFEVSDFLSLHCPSDSQTRQILNARTIELLPQGAIVVNSARGDLVDDEALIAALKTGRIAAAGLDVYAGEPAIHPGYRELENVFLLPHLGTSTKATRTRMGMLALDSLEAFFTGVTVPHRLV
ncbi:MAG: D-glycerate dehydrogenase [Sedimenticola sp.]